MIFPCSLSPFTLWVCAGFGKQAFQRTLFKFNEDNWSELPSRTGHSPSRQRTALSSKELTALPQLSESSSLRSGTAVCGRSRAAGMLSSAAPLRLICQGISSPLLLGLGSLPCCVGSGLGWRLSRAVRVVASCAHRAGRKTCCRALPGKLCAAESETVGFLVFCLSLSCRIASRQHLVYSSVLVRELAATNCWLCWSKGNRHRKWRGGLVGLPPCHFDISLVPCSDEEKVLAFVCQLFMLIFGACCKTELPRLFCALTMVCFGEALSNSLTRWVAF